MDILVVDDHAMFLESLSMLIEKHIPGSAISKATNGQRAVQMLDEIKPSVIILDINMPGMNGLEVAEYVNRKSHEIKIIVLTNFSGVAMLLSLINFVHGFLFKESGADELEKCINEVVKGEKYFCERSQKLMLNNVKVLKNLPSVRLTKRELIILKLLIKGKTSKEIAVLLGLKEKTVNSFREELLRKTKTRNTPELIVFGINNSLTHPFD